MPAEERLQRQANTVCAARLYKGYKIQEGQARYPGKDEISSITRKTPMFAGKVGMPEIWNLYRIFGTSTQENHFVY